MLQIALATALLVSPTTANRDIDHLMDLMSPDSGALIRIDDTGARLASDNPGLWLEVLADGEFQAALRETLLEFDLESDEIGGDLLACLSAHHGGVVAIGAGTSGFFGVLRVSDGFDESLDRLFTSAGIGLSETVALGDRAVRMVQGVEGQTIVLERTDDYLLIGSGPGETLESTFGRYAARLDGTSEPAEGWWRQGHSRVADGMIEIFADLPAAIGDELPEGVAAEYFDLAYIGLPAGAVDGWDTRLSVGFGPNEKVARMARAIRPANLDLVRLVPADALGFFSGSLDFAEFAESTALLVEDFVPSAKQDLDEVFEAGSATIGIDVWTELLPAFTGDILSISYPEESMEELLADEESLTDTPVPTIVMGVKDAEAILVLMETVEGLSGGLLAPSESESFSLWTADEDVLGEDVCIAVGEDHMILSRTDRAQELMARIQGTEDADKSFLTAAQIKALPQNVWLSVQDNAASWALLDDAMDILRVEMAEVPSMLTCMDIGLRHLKEEFSGYTYTTVQMTAQGVHLHAWAE